MQQQPRMLKRKKSPRSTSPSSSPPSSDALVEPHNNQQQQQQPVQQQQKSKSKSLKKKKDKEQKEKNITKQNKNNNNTNNNTKNNSSINNQSNLKNELPTTQASDFKSLEELHINSNTKENQQQQQQPLQQINGNSIPLKKKQKGSFIDVDSIDQQPTDIITKDTNTMGESFIPLSSAPVQIPTTTTTTTNNQQNSSTKYKQESKTERFINNSNTKSKSLLVPLWLQGISRAEDLGKLELEKEIELFYNWLSPNPLENRLRQMIVNEIESIVKASWPHAEIKVFGSFSTDLCIPSSDIDIQISGINDSVPSNNNNRFIYDPIRDLYNTFNKKYHTTYTNMRLIANAKVPIIKLVHRDSWYNVDICFDTPNGIENTVIVKSFLKKYKSMKLLLLLLKFFLFQNKLNETYTGGIGSYALALMVASYIQLRYVPYQQRVCLPKKVKSRASFKHAGNDTDYGAMLIEFFELYGRSFQYTQHAISLEHNGFYYEKEPQLGIYLTLIDPHDPSNDVGKNSFNISFIRGTLTNALVKIVSTDFVNDKYPAISFPTLLSRVIDERQVEQIARDRNKVLKFSQQLLDNNQLPLYDFNNEKPELIDIPEQQQDFVNNTNKSSSPSTIININPSSSSSSSSEEYSEESIQFIDSSSDVHSSSSNDIHNNSSSDISEGSMDYHNTSNTSMSSSSDEDDRDQDNNTDINNNDNNGDDGQKEVEQSNFFSY